MTVLCGAEGVRFPNLLNANQAIYQLIYDPVKIKYQENYKSITNVEKYGNRTHVFKNPILML